MPDGRIPLKNLEVIANERFLVAKWLVAVNDRLGLAGVGGEV